MSSCSPNEASANSGSEWVPAAPGIDWALDFKEYHERLAAGLTPLGIRSDKDPNDLFTFLIGESFVFKFLPGISETFFVQKNTANGQRRAVRSDYSPGAEPNTLEERKEFWSHHPGDAPDQSKEAVPREGVSLWRHAKQWMLSPSSAAAPGSEQADSKSDCPICMTRSLILGKVQPYRPGGGQELAVVLPCGHMVGAKCFDEFLRHKHPQVNGQDRPDDPSLLASCPLCRRPLYYGICGHVIRGILAPATDEESVERVPQTLDEGLESFPERCRPCLEVSCRREVVEICAPSPGAERSIRDSLQQLYELNMRWSSGGPDWASRPDHKFVAPEGFGGCDEDFLPRSS